MVTTTKLQEKATKGVSYCHLCINRSQEKVEDRGSRGEKGDSETESERKLDRSDSLLGFNDDEPIEETACW